jgi:hypothetical protein
VIAVQQRRDIAVIAFFRRNGKTRVANRVHPVLFSSTANGQATNKDKIHQSQVSVLQPVKFLPNEPVTFYSAAQTRQCFVTFFFFVDVGGDH